jgi:hemerythrin-like domain-containing protein
LPLFDGTFFCTAPSAKGLTMKPQSIRIIQEEHGTIAAIAKSLGMMIERGPRDDLAGYFEVVSAMLFYIDEFPERLHHPKETELLFPKVALRDPETAELIARLDKEHAQGESAIRELQYLLKAWELLGPTRREAFEVATKRHLQFYMAHMRVEEAVILPAALKVLDAQDWKEIDAAFVSNIDPLNGKYPRDPIYDHLFTRIVTRAPAPIGLGEQ